MQAIILAGGVGSRLRPITNEIPKPMVNMINKPVLYFIIELLKKHNITDIGLTLNYKASAISDYFGDGADIGVKLSYFIEESPLGTAGSVKAAAENLDENFLVISGDAFTEINLTEFKREHMAHKSLATIAVKEVEDATGFGVVKVQNGIIIDFIEKPLNPTEKLVNTGIYMFKREILSKIPNGFYDFGRDLLPRLIGNMRAYVTDEYWSDIGTLKSYYTTNLYLADHMQNYDFISSATPVS
ncbi:MAG: nucleotidyltransferase family protein [Clostridia bacterium]